MEKSCNFAGNFDEVSSTMLVILYVTLTKYIPVEPHCVRLRRRNGASLTYVVYRPSADVAARSAALPVN